MGYQSPLSNTHPTQITKCSFSRTRDVFSGDSAVDPRLRSSYCSSCIACHVTVRCGHSGSLLGLGICRQESERRILYLPFYYCVFCLTEGRVSLLFHAVRPVSLPLPACEGVGVVRMSICLWLGWGGGRGVCMSV